MSKILVADDSIAIQKVISLALKKITGGEVQITQAHSMNDCLRKLSQAKFSKIILDANVAGLKTPQDLKKICEAASDAEILLLLSNYENYNYDQLSEMGLTHYLNKPFSAEKLREKLFGMEGSNQASEQNSVGDLKNAERQSSAKITLKQSPKKSSLSEFSDINVTGTGTTAGNIFHEFSAESKDGAAKNGAKNQPVKPQTEAPLTEESETKRHKIKLPEIPDPDYEWQMEGLQAGEKPAPVGKLTENDDDELEGWDMNSIEQQDSHEGIENEPQGGSSEFGGPALSTTKLNAGWDDEDEVFNEPGEKQAKGTKKPDLPEIKDGVNSVDKLKNIVLNKMNQTFSSRESGTKSKRPVQVSSENTENKYSNQGGQSSQLAGGSPSPALSEDEIISYIRHEVARSLPKFVEEKAEKLIADYCEKNFKRLALEIIRSELQKLAEERTRYLSDS